MITLLAATLLALPAVPTATSTAAVTLAQEPKPAAQDPKPAAQEPKPAAQEPKPAAQEPKPAAQEPKPAAQEPKATPQDAKPAAQEPKPAEEPNPEYDAKLAEAGKDPAKLWAVHEWCLTAERRDLSKATLLKLIEVEPDHAEARKQLGHREYDGKWFESYSALSKYRREEDKRMLEEKGVVRFNDGWARPEDIPYLRMGWTKDEATGLWLDPHAAAAVELETRRTANGWKRQDNTWVSPDEFEFLEKDLWKCGEQWLELDKANEYHSQLYQWWEWPGERFVAMGTVPRENMEWARWWADGCYPELVRVLGLEPKRKPSFLVLKDLAQYNSFAAGDQNLGLPATEISGSSSVHFAYFAEAFIDGRVQPPVYRGQGVAFWDVDDEKLRGWGQYAVRHAAAHSYMEAIDPSWETISQAFANPGNLQLNTFWAEKKIPRWLRYGVAAYCERYVRDPSVAAGAEGQWAIRDWAIGQVRGGGELDPLEVIFALNIDANDPAGSARRIQEAGLLVSFMIDGNCAPVTAAHQAFRAALMAGKEQAETAQALQKALAEHTAELKKYAGYPEEQAAK
jgi:hypothetical protein